MSIDFFSQEFPSIARQSHTILRTHQNKKEIARAQNQINSADDDRCKTTSTMVCGKRHRRTRGMNWRIPNYMTALFEEWGTRWRWSHPHAASSSEDKNSKSWHTETVKRGQAFRNNQLKTISVVTLLSPSCLVALFHVWCQYHADATFFVCPTVVVLRWFLFDRNDEKRQFITVKYVNDYEKGPTMTGRIGRCRQPVAISYISPHTWRQCGDNDVPTVAVGALLCEREM